MHVCMKFGQSIAESKEYEGNKIYLSADGTKVATTTRSRDNSIRVFDSGNEVRLIPTL